MKFVVAKLSIVCVWLIVISLMLTGKSSAKIDLKTAAGIWLFEEGAGEVAKDSSGNGNDGKLMNKPKSKASSTMLLSSTWGSMLIAGMVRV